MSESVRKHKVQLTADQRGELETLARSGSSSAASARQARVLLLSDEDHVEGRRPDWQIAEIVGRAEKQVARVRQRFVTAGLAETLTRQF